MITSVGRDSHELATRTQGSISLMAMCDDGPIFVTNSVNYRLLLPVRFTFHTNTWDEHEKWLVRVWISSAKFSMANGGFFKVHKCDVTKKLLFAVVRQGLSNTYYSILSTRGKQHILVYYTILLLTFRWETDTRYLLLLGAEPVCKTSCILLLPGRTQFTNFTNTTTMLLVWGLKIHCMYILYGLRLNFGAVTTTNQY